MSSKPILYTLNRKLGFVLDVQWQQTELTRFLVPSYVTGAARQTAYAQAAPPFPPRSGLAVQRD